MIAVGEEAIPLDTYARETLQRLPLADATLSLWAYVLEPLFLAQVFAQYRGRSFEDTLSFARFVDLCGDALFAQGGSGRQSFTRAKEHGRCRRQRSSLREVAAGSLSLSLGFFTEGTARLERCCRPSTGDRVACECGGPQRGGGGWEDAQAGGQTLTARAARGGESVWGEITRGVSAPRGCGRNDGGRSGWGAQ